MKTGICWRCSSRGRLENSFRVKLLFDWRGWRYCERLLLAGSGHRVRLVVVYCVLVGELASIEQVVNVSGHIAATVIASIILLFAASEVPVRLIIKIVAVGYL